MSLYIPLPMTTSELGPITQPVAVSQTREIVQGQQAVKQALVQ